MSVSLANLPGIAGFNATHTGGSPMVSDVTHDSKSVPAASLFCCVRGQSADGHDFAMAAIDGGAVALMVERHLPVETPQLQVDDVRRCMALSAAAVHGFPSHEMTVVGITGTNGKTTTAHMLGAILETASMKPKVAGTLNSVRTTPESTDLQRALRSWRAEGGEAYVMEVSSHALDQNRVLGTRFAAGVFTNLTQEHLDYHGTLEAYFRAKSRLFTDNEVRIAVINRDDVHGRLLLDIVGGDVVTYGMSDASEVKMTPVGVSCTWNGVHLDVPMGGAFNLSNALAAASTARALGVGNDAIAEGLRTMSRVRGRMEQVPNDQGIVVLVDYAHTPDALEQLLTNLRASMKGDGSLVVVFGCGGDRDRAKRAPMGRVAADLADRVVLTSDNSRTEATMRIIDEVISGVLPKHVAKVSSEENRAEAIRIAIESARPGDVIVIAGKGHETTQDINGVVTEFDDVKVAREFLGAAK